MKKLFMVAVLVLLACTSINLAAQDTSQQASYSKVEIDEMLSSKATTDSMTMVWMVLGAALVFVMQAGFALVEVGELCMGRAKPAFSARISSSF